MAMNQEIKSKWVAALRSGKYKQGKHRLRSTCDTFCCLGVLTDLYIKEKGEQWNLPSPDDTYYSFEFNSTFLPTCVKVWAGLYDCDPQLGEDRASLQNDYRNRTFLEIADLIEAEL